MACSAGPSSGHRRWFAPCIAAAVCFPAQPCCGRGVLQAPARSPPPPRCRTCATSCASTWLSRCGCGAAATPRPAARHWMARQSCGPGPCLGRLESRCSARPLLRTGPASAATAVPLPMQSRACLLEGHASRWCLSLLLPLLLGCRGRDSAPSLSVHTGCPSKRAAQRRPFSLASMLLDALPCMMHGLKCYNTTTTSQPQQRPSSAHRTRLKP